MRWLSHLEVVHALERSIRRAGLPFAVTQGFNPHLKVAFGPALPVGTAGDNEYLDVWLREYTEADATGRAAPEGVARRPLAPRGPIRCGEGAVAHGGAHHRESTEWRLRERELQPDEVQAALAQVVSVGELTVVQQGQTEGFRSGAQLSRRTCVSVDREGGVVVEVTTRMGPEGSLRPETLVRAAIENTAAEMSAVHTTRLDTLVETDEGVWSRPVVTGVDQWPTWPARC